jgi:hypothetical protein
VKVGERMMLRRGVHDFAKVSRKGNQEEGLAESTWKQMSKSMQEEINPHRQQTKKICPLAFVCFLF